MKSKTSGTASKQDTQTYIPATNISHRTSTSPTWLGRSSRHPKAIAKIRDKGQSRVIEAKGKKRQLDTAQHQAMAEENVQSSTDRTIQKSPRLTEVQIDKMVVAMYPEAISDAEAEVVAKRLRKLIRKPQEIDGRPEFSKGSSKGDIFKRVVIQRLPSGAVVKYAAEPSRGDVRQRLQITLNPAHIESTDIKHLRKALKSVLGPDWNAALRRALCMRIDSCVDGLDVDVNTLLVMFAGARSHGVFYVQVDQTGRIQTIYLGSVQSATHGIVYDQNASDRYKRLVGEKVLVRERVADDAEVVLRTQGARTRFEVRNVMKQGVSLLDLQKMPTALDKFRVFELSERAIDKLSATDAALLDVYRLRGPTGARAHLRAFKNGKAAEERLDEVLARHAAPWWDSPSLVSSMRRALRSSPVWCLLSSGDD